MKFTPIKPKKVSTQIVEQIRTSVLAGEFNPGEKLPPERELAEMFGVSRPSVREALNILASSGLVETYQGGGDGGSFPGGEFGRYAAFRADPDRRRPRP